jgi:hypothetical protein
VTRDVFRGILVLGFLGMAIGGSIWGCGRYRSYEAEESRQKDKDRNWLIDKLRSSRYGSKGWRDETASDFLGESTTTDTCEWLFIPTWHGSTKNPNWVSARKGSDGANLICRTYTHDQYNSAMWFEYDFEDGRGIVGLKWGYWSDD